MTCKKTETALLRSLDNRLDNPARSELEAHLELCPQCRKRKKEYEVMIETLNQAAQPELKPYFWERLKPKLKETRRIEPWTVWKKFSLNAIPLSLLMVAVLAATVLLFIPSAGTEIDLSQTGYFLLQNENPLVETQPFLSEQQGIDNHLLLIFSSLDETEGIRRFFP